MQQRCLLEQSFLLLAAVTRKESLIFSPSASHALGTSPDRRRRFT